MSRGYEWCWMKGRTTQYILNCSYGHYTVYHEMNIWSTMQGKYRAQVLNPWYVWCHCEELENSSRVGNKGDK